MAAYDIVFADPGGEYYFSLGVTAPGVWNSSNSALTSSAPAGAATAFAIFSSSNQNVGLKSFASNYASMILGHRHYFGSAAWVNNRVLAMFLDGATTQVDVRTDAVGHLFLTRNGTAIGSASSNVLTAGWHYIELKAALATGATGSAEVRVDGVVWATVSSVQTASTVNAYANGFSINFVVAANNYCKDIYCMGDTGTGPYSTYLGDVTVAVEYPNGVGVNQQWTPNTGTQTAAVQDGTTHTGTWPDGDTTYISDSTAGHISDFAHQALSLTGTIYGVVHASYMRKDDAGSRAVRQVCLSGGTTEDNGSDLSLGNTYQYYYDVIENDPHTGAQWTVANYNSATFGVKEIS